MADGLSTPRGTADVLPDEAVRRDGLNRAAQHLLESAGYRHIETPMFESTDLFKRGVGGSTDIVRKEMYTFEDGGGRSLTLRPEGTASVARAYIQHGMHKLPQPVKLWYSGPFFRYERAQAGRQRQFAQIGAEVLGSDAPAVDAELITLLHQLIELAGGQKIVLKLGSLGSLEARAEYRERLVSFLRSRESEVSDDVKSRIDENPLRAFDAKDEATQAVMKNAPLLLDHLSGDDADHFTEVRALLDGAGVPYEIDKTLVRGLDYYTRTVFEFSSAALGAQSGVGGGGRYDGLIEQIGGPATPACGWAAGIERLLLAGADQQWTSMLDDVSVYVAAEPAQRVAAFALARRLGRGLSVQSDLSGRSFNGQLKAASRLGALVTVVVTSDTTATIRRRGRDDLEVALDDAVPAIVDALIDDPRSRISAGSAHPGPASSDTDPRTTA